MIKEIRNIEFLETPTINDIEQDHLGSLLSSSQIRVTYIDDTTLEVSAYEFFQNENNVYLGTLFNQSGLGITTDDSSYQTRQYFYPQSQYQDDQYYDCFFKEVRTGLEGGLCNITLSFGYGDSISNYFTYTFTFGAIINGLVEVIITPKNDYVDTAKIFNVNAFNVYFLDGLGNKIAKTELDGTDELTSDISTYGNLFTKGVNIIVFEHICQLSAGGTYTISGNCTQYVYNNSDLHLSVENYKEDYKQGQTISISDLEVYLVAEIDDNNEFRKQVYDFTIVPKKLSHIGTNTINITRDNLSTTYQINVSGREQDNMYIVDKKPSDNIISEKVMEFTTNRAFGTLDLKLLKVESLDDVELTAKKQDGTSYPITLVKVDYEAGVVYYNYAPIKQFITITATCTIKKNGYKISLYGEIQSDYNLNFVIDGTKDSGQVVVLNHIREDIKPNTLVYLENTDSWWIISKDKVVKHFSEGKALYEHNISLQGAIEILNARDLTNCGFNVNRYTLGQMLDRVINFTDFEFATDFNLYPLADLDKKVEYLKTFQNYSPLSAIREIFDGMNLTPKMKLNTIEYNDNIYIDSATIYAISKTGNSNQPIDISEFDDVEETITNDKSNYGTRVVSNAENVVSANVVRYPTAFGVGLTSTENTLSYDSAILRLPSNIYEVKDITFYSAVRVREQGDEETEIFVKSYTQSEDELRTIIRTELYIYDAEDLENVLNAIKYVEQLTIQFGGIYDEMSKSWNEYSLVKKRYGAGKYGISLNTKRFADVDKVPWSTIYYEQGKDTLHNFAFLGMKWEEFLKEKVVTLKSGRKISCVFGRGINTPIQPNDVIVAVNYIPMGDLKLKTDNSLEENDTNIFNQNGKLVDSKALSKLINSHSIEISSNEITLSKTFFDYFDVYSVGQVVIDENNERYVINNVSMDIHDNDNFGYYIECQFTLTKETACKSTMISANNNIRDYDCPQENNIVRTQLYKDYIELDYEKNGSTEFPYLGLNKIFNFGSVSYGYYETFTLMFSANMNYNGNSTFYYTIGTTRYYLNKQMIYVADFKDNNIIGYEANSRYFILDVSKLLSNYESFINVPISYVDNVGELNSLCLLFINEEELLAVYDEFDAKKTIGRFVSVPQDMYNFAIENRAYEIMIQEPNYKKDGLEIPVFEYICQMGETNGIVFGNDFLVGERLTDGEFRYGFAVVDEAYITNENATLFMQELNQSNCRITYTLYNDTLRIIALSGLFTKGKNIIFYRDKVVNDTHELTFLFALNNCKAESGSVIDLYINNWKLK